MKTMKTFSRRIAALLLVVTVGITALAPAASVEAALAAWAAAPVLAEPGAAAAALAAWAAAAATAAEPDADADIMTKGKPHLTVGLPFCPFVI